IVDVVGDDARAQRRSDAAVVLGEQAERLGAVLGVAQLAPAALGPRAEIRRCRDVAARSAEVELVTIAAITSVALRGDRDRSRSCRDRHEQPISRQYRS